MLSDRQAVEFFHLELVRLLCAGPDKSRFAIKGGCNLRFFFDSIRYSEDIGFDVHDIPVHSLKEKTSRVLVGPALKSSLKSRGLEVADSSAPKQTETTQRWKVSLKLQGRSLPLHTKVEFSRRPSSEGARVEPISQAVIAEYALMPTLAPHYPLEAAIRQKVHALIGRSIVQARDVFDLSVLFARAAGDPESLRSMQGELEKAIEKTMDVSYDAFQSQVVSYLKPEHVDSFGSPEAWNAIQAQVIGLLEKALK